MAEAFIFADEAGDFKFLKGANISKYFILCTMRMEKCDLGDELLELKRSLVRKDMPVGDKFHASSDQQGVRDEVFNVISKFPFRVDATILEKSKAQPQTRVDEALFYKYAWHYHAKFIVPHPVNRNHDILACAAALETNKGKAAFKLAFNNAIQQHDRNKKWTTEFRPSAADPCLQAVDYCAWAIQRRWEMGDPRSHNIIADKIQTEFDLWRMGNRHYY